MSIHPGSLSRLKPFLILTSFLVSIAGCTPSPETSIIAESAPISDSLPMPADIGHKPLCRATTTETAGEMFVRRKVHHLPAPTTPGGRAGFDYKSNGYANPAARRGYQRPVFDQAVSPAAAGTLAAAFGLLTQPFQDALCANLDYVFVDDNEGNFADDGDSGMGWAFWEVTAKQTQDYRMHQPVPATTESQADGRGRFIALPASLVADPPLVQDLLRRTTEKLLGGLGGPVTIPADFVTVAPTPAIGPEEMKHAALAAALLHELGHVLWFQTCVADKSTKCDQFRMVGWRTDLTWPSSGIHNPKLPLGALRRNAREPGIDEITAAARQGDLSRLYDLLGVGPARAAPSNWVSLLAAAAPDEDFAETLTILGLQRNRLGVDYHGPDSRRVRHVAQSFNPVKARLAGDLLPALLGPQMR